jgi:hypothetical protein
MASEHAYFFSRFTRRREVVCGLAELCTCMAQWATFKKLECKFGCHPFLRRWMDQKKGSSMPGFTSAFPVNLCFYSPTCIYWSFSKLLWRITSQSFLSIYANSIPMCPKPSLMHSWYGFNCCTQKGDQNTDKFYWLHWIKIIKVVLYNTMLKISEKKFDLMLFRLRVMSNLYHISQKYYKCLSGHLKKETSL